MWLHIVIPWLFRRVLLSSRQHRAHIHPHTGIIQYSQFLKTLNIQTAGAPRQRNKHRDIDHVPHFLGHVSPCTVSILN